MWLWRRMCLNHKMDLKSTNILCSPVITILQWHKCDIPTFSLRRPVFIFFKVSWWTDELRGFGDRNITFIVAKLQRLKVSNLTFKCKPIRQKRRKWNVEIILNVLLRWGGEVNWRRGNLYLEGWHLRVRVFGSDHYISLNSWIQRLLKQ